MKYFVEVIKMNKSIIIRLKNSRFIRFLFVGIINTLFGYTVFALMILIRLDYRFSLLITTICGVLFNFKTIGTLVFKAKDSRPIIRFVGVYLIIYLLNDQSLQIANSLGMNILWAQAGLLLPLASLSYILNKKFVFNDKRE